MISLQGYKAFELSNLINVNDADKNDYDEILVSTENILVFKKFCSQKELAECWENLVYFVGGYIQNNINKLNLDESFLWNIYIVYLIDKISDLKLKLEIESNKFCCKKYVVELEKYESEAEAVLKEIPILADIDFKVQEGIFGQSEKDIKRVICNNVNNVYSNFFIATDKIEAAKINDLIDDMMELDYEQY